MTQSTPLCVDLDGTLTRVDTLHEQLIRAFGSWNGALGLVRTLPSGRAGLKAYLARTVPLLPERLPYHQELLRWLKAERAARRRIVLVTASNQAVADAVASHLGIFDEAVGSDDSRNLRGRAKADHLVSRFGERNFAYAGNDASDVHVWKHAGSAIPVAAPPSVARAAARAAPVERQFASEGDGWLRAVVRALRPHQWLKNLLVFVPMVTSRDLANVQGWMASALTLGAFCALASAGYLINDLSDLSADRAHSTKRHRPIASGEVGVALATVLAVVLTLGGFSLAWAGGAPAWAIAYFATSVLYSMVLKTLPLVDLFALGGLYTVRVLAGGQASGHAVSEWLLAFSIFLFVALATMKRVAELRARTTASALAKRRPYMEEDGRFLEILGLSSSVASSLVLALYARWITPEGTQTIGAVLLWTVPPVMLFWQLRLWLSTFRGYMLEDPLAYAMKDWVTRLAAVLVGLLFVLAGVL